MKQIRQVLGLLSEAALSDPETGREKRGYYVLGVITVVLILVPACFTAGFVSYVMTLAMMEEGGREEGLLFIIQLLSAFAVIFGFNVVLNEFYHSKNIERLLPLPLDTKSVIAARFIRTYFAESGMEFMVIFSAFIGYMAAAGISISSVIAMIIGIFLLPLIPLVYCGIISLILMRFAAVSRNKKLMNLILVLFSLALIYGAFVSFGGLAGFSVETYVKMLAEKDNAFLNLCNIIFYPVYLLIHAQATADPVGMVCFLLIALALGGIFLLLASVLYMPGLWSVLSAGNGKSGKKKAYTYDRHSVFVSLLKTEFRTIFRTPAYISNCVLINLFWPIMLVIIYFMQRGSNTVLKFILMYKAGYILSNVTLMAGVMTVAALTVAANAIAATSLTRYGSSADFVKAVPVGFSRFADVWLTVSVVISYASVLLDIIILKTLFLLDGAFCVYLACLGLFMVVLISCIGMRMDISDPRLNWESEVQAMRANVNVFMHMAIAIMTAASFSLLAFAIYYLEFTTALMIESAVFTILFTVMTIVYMITMDEVGELTDGG